MFENVLGKKCIVRGNNSGVFYATVVKIEDKTVVEMQDVRRVYYWDGANTISDLAVQGSKTSYNCKITVPVEQVVITDCVEINVCTEKAINNLDSIKIWTY